MQHTRRLGKVGVYFPEKLDMHAGGCIWHPPAFLCSGKMLPEPIWFRHLPVQTDKNEFQC